MIDVVSALFIAILILFFIQIVALVRIRQVIVRLRSILNLIAPFVERQHYIQRSRQINMRVCQFCKFRQTYIKTVSSGEEEFYYRCRLSDQDIQLNDTCDRFEVESEI